MEPLTRWELFVNWLWRTTVLWWHQCPAQYGSLFERDRTIFYCQRRRLHFGPHRDACGRWEATRWRRAQNSLQEKP
jgi:hypothetical protein